MSCNFYAAKIISNYNDAAATVNSTTTCASSSANCGFLNSFSADSAITSR
jgi:hypothetical protein